MVVMVLDLMHVHYFYEQMVAGVIALLTFGADMSSSVHVDNKKKDILVFVEDPTQRLDNKTITAEAKYRINFTQSGKNCVKSPL